MQTMAMHELSVKGYKPKTPEGGIVKLYVSGSPDLTVVIVDCEDDAPPPPGPIGTCNHSTKRAEIEVNRVRYNTLWRWLPNALVRVTCDDKGNATDFASGPVP